LKPENGGIYSCNVSSTLAGEFNFPLTAMDFFGNEVTSKGNILITVLKEEDSQQGTEMSMGSFLPRKLKTL